MVRGGLLAGVVALALLAGWQIRAIMRSDAALVRGDPAAALRARPGNPEALTRLATARLAAGDAVGAETLARQLLQGAPADGRGYRLLAQVAESRGQERQAATLYAIAARRAPRDLQARAWLAQNALAAGNYRAALEHIDQVLRTSAGAGARLFPIMAKLAQDPAFADALAQRLGSQPPWRDGMLATLHNPQLASAQAADQVLAGMQRRNSLDTRASEAWIESMIQQGRWGEAFARWAGPRVAAGRRLPLLYNGDFAEEPQGGGFDWRIPSVPGVLVTIEPFDSAGMLHLRFLGRRVPGTPLAEHALMLAPGTYHLAWRERMDALRADQGLAWRVSCAGQGEPLAQAPATQGSRAWRAQELIFTVPAGGCMGQWLQLAPTGNTSAGQVVSGDVWHAAMNVTKLNKK